MLQLFTGGSQFTFQLSSSPFRPVFDKFSKNEKTDLVTGESGLIFFSFYPVKTACEIWNQLSAFQKFRIFQIQQFHFTHSHHITTQNWFSEVRVQGLPSDESSDSSLDDNTQMTSPVNFLLLHHRGAASAAVGRASLDLPEPDGRRRPLLPPHDAAGNTAPAPSHVLGQRAFASNVCSGQESFGCLEDTIMTESPKISRTRTRCTKTFRNASRTLNN
jgi:hypothetical protein